MLRAFVDAPVIRLAHQAGMDFVLIDLEHGHLGHGDVARAAALARALGLGVLVRVPELARAEIGRCLDAGVDGILCPMLETEEMARQLVSLTKYPPLGVRGFASAGGHSDYAKVTTPAEFLAEENRSILAIAQIESRLGIENLEGIASVPGMDALLVGPNDLAISLGVPGDLHGEAVRTAIGSVVETCERHDLMFGMHGPVSLLEEWAPKGMRLLVNSIDLDFVAESLRRVSEQSQQILGSKTS